MKKEINIRTFCSAFVVATVVGLAAPAFAQDATPPPAPAPEVKRTGRMAGDIGNGSLGIGVTRFVSGLTGPEVVYDFGAWHLDGTITFDHQPNAAGTDSANTFAFGVGGWYHLHLGENSDFSVGGSFGLVNYSPPGPGNSATGFEFEPGIQVRAFITPNVALHGGAGIVFAFGDQTPDALTKQIALMGQVTGDFGFTYYFR